MSQIKIANLTFAYEGSFDNVFENVSFTADTGWKTGLVARNGRGKTTLLKLLTGAYGYSGEISANADFRYFPYEPKECGSAIGAVKSVFPELSDWELIRELNQLEFDVSSLDRPFYTLSPGERTKLLLSALFLGENAFPLIDEPTNHLDMKGREALGEYLKRKRGFILVSHDRALLDLCTDHTLAINKTGIEVVSGSFSVWQASKQQRDDFELAANEKLKKDIRRLRESAEQSRRWADKNESMKLGKKKAEAGNTETREYIAEQSRRMQQRRKNLERRQENAVAEKSALLKDVEESEPLKLRPLSYRAERLSEFRDVSVYYGERAAVSGVSFSVLRGERVAVCGRNGSGKSSLLKLFLQDKPAFSGKADIGSGLIVSFVPQDASFLCGSAEAYAKEHGVNVSLFFAILRKLGFSRIQFEKDMADYSAGQKKKVLIAASLCESAHLYVWDEPLNYMDLQSRMQIEELILAFSPTIVFVEHDRAFCKRVSTKTVEL